VRPTPLLLAALILPATLFLSGCSNRVERIVGNERLIRGPGGLGTTVSVVSFTDRDSHLPRNTANFGPALLLGQSGSFVPARSARIGVVDRLFTRVGASDRLGAGQSTFMVEMQETADILRNASGRSLVLLDEIGRGTSTYDGLALAWAVTEFLHGERGPRPRTIFATHYHELTQLAASLPRLRNVQVAVQEWGESVVFLHRIVEGAADRSYGIHVAQRAGLPDEVIERAQAVLAELERERTAEHLGPQGRGRAPSSEAAGQLPLFGTAPHPVAEALRAVDLDATTPMQALALLADLKKKI